MHLPQIRPGRMASDMEAVPVGDPAMRITLDPKPRQQTDARPGLLGNAMARVRGNGNDDRVHSVQPRVTHGTPRTALLRSGRNGLDRHRRNQRNPCRQTGEYSLWT
ncbi:hypothetical protein [Lamprocystis purpurea]|jgi:hypothetical protein|uniref:hypothetical protein n=1 Tax=Lamprocystis purpurea TaxID=61598 RepID=UPI001B7F9064|nr:hypothetical protein [Lamprocystis purpurea]